MPKLEWDKIGEHFYETGVDQGVFYPVVNGAYTGGEAWNGLTAPSANSTFIFSAIKLTTASITPSVFLAASSILAAQFGQSTSIL